MMTSKNADRLRRPDDHAADDRGPPGRHPPDRRHREHGGHARRRPRRTTPRSPPGRSTTRWPASRPTHQEAGGGLPGRLQPAQRGREAGRGRRGRQRCGRRSGPAAPTGRPRRAPSGPIVASSQAAQIAVDTALAQRGKPYVWAAAGPGSFDCSGLVEYAYGAAGIGLPHSSLMQSQMGRRSPAPSSGPATWSSSTARSATWASTSATARWCTHRRPATSSRSRTST